jgi:hypothetical protein
LGFGEGREKKKCGRRKGKEAPRSRGKEETVNCVGGGRRKRKSRFVLGFWEEGDVEGGEE